MDIDKAINNYLNCDRDIESTIILKSLEKLLYYTKAYDKNFDSNNYMFVLGIGIVYKLLPDLVIECRQGNLFGIKVCIDYNDINNYKLFKEVNLHDYFKTL